MARVGRRALLYDSRALGGTSVLVMPRMAAEVGDDRSGGVSLSLEDEWREHLHETFTTIGGGAGASITLLLRGKEQPILRAHERERERCVEAPLRVDPSRTWSARIHMRQFDPYTTLLYRRG